MTPAKRNIRMRLEKRKATEIRLIKEISRPKILIDEYFDQPKPSSYYLEIAKQRFRSLNQSKSSRLVFSRSKKSSLDSSRVNLLPKSKVSKAPSMNLPLDNIIPEWLQAREDFKESVKHLKSEQEKRVPLILDLEYHHRSTEDNEILRNFLKSVKFFENLPSQVIIDTSNRLIKETYLENQIIVKKGEDADSLIIFYEGTAKIVIDGQVVAVKQAKDVVGDTSLDFRLPRSADVVAETYCVIFKLMREDYEAAVLHLKRLERQENLKFLTGIQIFQNWKPLKLNRMSSVLNLKYFDSDSVLYKRGDPSVSMFFLKKGKVEVFGYVPLEQCNKWPVSNNQWVVHQVNKEYLVRIAKIKPGQYFGDVEVLEKKHRDMKAVTVTSSVILELNKDQFPEIFNENDLENLMKSSFTKVRDPKVLESKLSHEISSRITNENALLDALKVDFSNLHGRDSNLDPKIKKLNTWLSSYRSRRTESSKNFKQKVVYENSRSIRLGASNCK
jgi:CRP-like cAMP-binding protein